MPEFGQCENLRELKLPSDCANICTKEETIWSLIKSRLEHNISSPLRAIVEPCKDAKLQMSVELQSAMLENNVELNVVWIPTMFD